MEEFTYGLTMNPTWVLDDGWIVEHPMRETRAKEVPNTDECLVETDGYNRHHPQHAPEGVPLPDEDYQAHRDRMSMFYFMQDLYAHTEHYLIHQVDTWEVAQHFRDRFSGGPPAPFYGCYHYP